MRYFLLIATLFTACSTQPKVNAQQKAEAAVNEYLKAHLNDPSSYQPVKFGTLDSIAVDTAYIHERRLSELNASNDLLKGADMKLFYDSFAITVSDSVHSLGTWQIEHTYRAKNGFGALMLTTDLFYLDSNFKVSHTNREKEE